MRWWARLRCRHDRTRCVHGDEILLRMSMFGRIYRRACLDCGRSLPGLAICTVYPGVHTTG